MSKTLDRPETSHSLAEDFSAALDEGVGEAVSALPPWLMEASPAFPVQVKFDPPQARTDSGPSH